MTNASTASPAPRWADWLADQVDWHWRAQARPRLDGLTDEEYLWEPAPGAWSVRPQGSAPRPGAVLAGKQSGRIDFAFPPPDPAPLTTIAWRIAHLVVGALGIRNATYFGGPPIDFDGYDYPLTADRALADLDAGFARWVAGVRGFDEAGLLERCREVGFEQDSVAQLVLHINRELIHHLAEVALLRDLWLHRGDRTANPSQVD